MSEDIKPGDRVQVRLNTKTWGSEGWFEGTVIRIDPYSEHRSFFWVELDKTGDQPDGGMISVLNPKNIRKV